MINTSKFKQFLTIPEAALVWEGISIDLLVGAAYIRPGVPLIVGHPDVAARAVALIEATDYGTLMECGRADPDMRMPEPENRIISRQALLSWIQKYWPDEQPGKRKPTDYEQPPIPQPEPEDRFLTPEEAWTKLGIKKATFYRRLKTGEIPSSAPGTKPPRWRLSEIEAVIKGNPIQNYSGIEEDI